jgi:RNA polymerase sigma-70 factor (ECF subfamily)
MDEQGIIKRCLEGDAGCFQQIVTNHTAPLMAAAMTILGNRQDAEDLCQETLIQAYHNLSSFNTGKSMRVWLYTVLYRRCLNAIKRKKRLAGILNRLKAEPESWILTHNSDSEEAGVLHPRIYKILNPRERTILSLWINEGYTAMEMSAILKCPPGTARYHLFNVRKKIRDFMEKNHENLSNR